MELIYKTNLIASLEKAVSVALVKLKMPTDQVKVETNKEYQFGDYSTNIAMLLAKSLKKNPKDLAEEIKGELVDEIIEKVEVAGPGFINIYLKQKFKLAQLDKLATSAFLKEIAANGKGKTMVIDYSAPNIAKPFGIGHLRSTNIGQAIYNIYKILGWKTIGDNHIGDWGTQFGKLIVAIKKFNTKPVEDLTIEELERLYVEFHKKAEVDEKLVEEGREWFAKLEKGDAEARRIWQLCIDVSMKEHNKMYDLLKVKIDVVNGESFYEDKMQEVIDVCKEKKLAKIGEGGAWIIEFPSMPPAILIKSNGTTIYFTRDLATALYRKRKWNPDLVIYEVGADQTLHLKQVFETSRILGYMPKYGMVHVAHGMIRWKDRKFSTRKGETIHLSEIIDRARLEAKKVVESAEISRSKSEDKQEVIDQLAIGAIKFTDLSSEPKRDIIFDWERIMSLEGDSGPYLQYAFARCVSLMEKAKANKEEVGLDWKNQEPVEMELVNKLLCLESKILEAAERYAPSVLATYALEVARSFSQMYGSLPILNNPKSARRIYLTTKTKEVLAILLQLLGITAIEKL